MMAPVNTGTPEPAPLVIRARNPRAGALCLVAVFGGTIAGGFSTVAIYVSYPLLVALLAYGVRGLFVMVRADARGLMARNQWRTVKVGWDQVEAIDTVARGRERRAARGAGVVVLTDGRRIPLEATLVSQDAMIVPSAADRGGPQVEALRGYWERAGQPGA
jgi:hypothetical protein